MIIRFFLFIWGALLVTLCAVVILVSQLNLTPPDQVQLRLQQVLIHKLMVGISIRDEASARRFFDEHRNVFPDLQLEADTTCQGQFRFPPNRETDCLMVTQIEQQPKWFDAIVPLLLPVGLGMVISLITASLLTQRFARPIQIIGIGLTRLASGELGARISYQLNSADRELAELGQAFDHAAKKFQDLTTNRERLLHDISHEIRSPLARLQAALGILQLNPARLEPMHKQMDADIDRLNRLVEEILTLARYERSELELSIVPQLDLVDTIHSILIDANFEGQSKQLHCHYEGDETLLVNADPELMHRALENIIRNAVRFSADGGEVIVRGRSDAERVRVSVLDTGPGVLEEELNNLFDPFMRGQNGRNSGGTGLGLAIASHAIRANGGTIAVKNRKSEGLAVCIELPCVSLTR